MQQKERTKNKIPKVNGNHSIPLLFRHRGKRLIPQDPSVGNQDVYTAESARRNLDEGVTILCRTYRSRGFTASCRSIVSDNDGWGNSGPRTIDDFIDNSLGVLLAHVVHNHISSQPCKQQCIGSTESRPGAGYNCRLAIVPYFRSGLPIGGCTTRGLQLAL